jgi:bromodomain-containing factor 1
MEKLLSYHISSMFSQPVDPIRDQCPTYFQIVSRPMDLGTICTKLRNHEYDSVTDWQQDVNQVWENASLYNGRTSIVSILARHLQTVFKEMTDFITNDERSDWLNKLTELRSNLTTVRGQSPKALQPQKATKVKEVVPGGKPPKSRPTSQEHKKVIPPPRTTVPTRSASARIQTKQFTHDEICKLTDDVTQLEDDDEAMGKITDLIRKHEPHLMVGEEVEIELSKLRAETLVELRTLVDKLL